MKKTNMWIRTSCEVEVKIKNNHKIICLQTRKSHSNRSIKGCTKSKSILSELNSIISKRIILSCVNCF